MHILKKRNQEKESPMDLTNITSCSGTIQTVMPSPDICGAYTILMQTDNGSPCIHVTPQTYVVDCVPLRPGMQVAAFHDTTPLPPNQHSAYPTILVTVSRKEEHIVLDRFDHTLTAQNHSLHLNISAQTDIQTANGQRFTCHPGNRILLVYYSVATKSLPAQTSPRKIIVL